MEEPKRIPEHRKRRRRRRVERNPVPALLLPIEELKGNSGLISEDLVDELYSYDRHSTDDDSAPLDRFVAVAPWSPPSLGDLADIAWTIVPVTSNNARVSSSETQRPSTLYIPASAPALRALAETLQANPYGKNESTDHKGFEVKIIDVKPLALDTIYVSIDGDALKKHEEIQARFGGGFLNGSPNGPIGKGKKPMKLNGHVSGSDRAWDAVEHGFVSAVRQALISVIIARQGDMLPLPLPAHPITHVPFPPLQITLCEPVSQGLPNSRTKIVVNRVHHSSNAEPPPAEKPLPVLSSSKSLTDFDITDGDCTSNEAFHSAVEDGDTSDNDVHEMASESDKDSPQSSDESSEEDMITMSTPSLPIRSSGVLSSKTAATPRPSSARANGISTPGSIFSNMTNTTARQGGSYNGRVFKVHGLLKKVPNELLQPPPSVDDDDECRVFVDMKILVRLGCFSGDWVRLIPENAKGNEHQIASLRHEERFRPIKIYGLIDLQPASTSRSAGGMPQTRRSSIVSSIGQYKSTLNAWLSPILLANLGQPVSVRIIPLLDPTPQRPSSRSRTGKRKVESSAMPPIAEEMTLLKVATPLSTERAVQSGMFTALKHYFEQKRRVVQQGDLIALAVDAKTSRILSSTGQTTEPDDETEGLLVVDQNGHGPGNMLSGAAWFKIGSITGSEPLEASDLVSNVWSGAATVEPGITRTRQTGSEQSRVPPQLSSTWEYYLGLQHLAADSRSPIDLSRQAPKPYVPAVRRRMRELMAATTSSRAIHLGMDPVVILLHSTHRNVGKATLATEAACDLGMHIFVIDAYDLLAEGTGAGDIKSEAMLHARVERALSCGAQYTSILLRHVEAMTADRMITAIKSLIKDVRVLILTTTELGNVSGGLRSVVTHEIEVAAPDENERQGLLENIILRHGLRLAHDVDLGAVAIKTAALVAGNLDDIVERSIIARQERLEILLSAEKTSLVGSNSSLLRDVLVAGGEAVHCLTKADFDIAVEAARKNFADAIGAPKIPNVTWDDVGGLENVKDAVMETIQLPLERPELFAKGMKKRSGILFYGPPGTGKTLLAKAIATEFSLNFFSIKGPELLNMYIGESEANVRRVFQRARDARPCVVFFDELDSVAPKRGNQGDSGGVMDRIVSQLLAELDGMSDGDENGGGVFVIGATNRPDLLDQALLRPGRFDKMLYLGVSDTSEKQNTILEALTRKFMLHPELSLRHIAESLPFTYTGADLYALCSDAMLKAITRQASAVDAKIKDVPGGPVTTAYFFDHLATQEDIAVTVTEQDFAAAKNELVPSVSLKELEHYQRVRHEFEGPITTRTTSGTSTAPRTRIPAPINMDSRLLSPASSNKRPKAPGRNDTAVLKPSKEIKGKGKGKATTWDSDDDDDEAYVTSNDFASPERRNSGTTNGAFGVEGSDDDGELYS